MVSAAIHSLLLHIGGCHDDSKPHSRYPVVLRSLLGSPPWSKSTNSRPHKSVTSFHVGLLLDLTHTRGLVRVCESRLSEIILPSLANAGLKQALRASGAGFRAKTGAGLPKFWVRPEGKAEATPAACCATLALGCSNSATAGLATPHKKLLQSGKRKRAKKH